MSEVSVTPLHKQHIDLGAKMVDFHGWEMPISYSSIIEEHHQVRSTSGLFDVSHMGRLIFKGPDRLDFLKKMLPTNLNTPENGDVVYSFFCNERGTVIDDLTVLIFPDELRMVVNASNRVPVLAWLNQNKGGFDVEIIDETLETVMIAIQGPEAVEITNRFSPDDLSSLSYFTFIETTFDGEPALISRTGYTGEDGFEIVCAKVAGAKVWQVLLDGGSKPIGLGARDTLRMEVCFPLYGQELSDDLTPLNARLGFDVNSTDDYIGKAALQKQRDDGLDQRLVAFKVEGRLIARGGSEILLVDEKVGFVSSGSFCPSLGGGAGMGFVKTELSKSGTEGLVVQIRNKRVPIEIAKIPLVPKRVAPRK